MIFFTPFFVKVHGLKNAYIHMEPHVVFLADVCDVVDGIKRSVHRSTGCGVHKERNVTLHHTHKHIHTHAYRKHKINIKDRYSPVKAPFIELAWHLGNEANKAELMNCSPSVREKTGSSHGSIDPPSSIRAEVKLTHSR